MNATDRDDRAADTAAHDARDFKHRVPADFYRNFYRTGRNGSVIHSTVQHADSRNTSSECTELDVGGRPRTSSNRSSSPPSGALSKHSKRQTSTRFLPLHAEPCRGAAWNRDGDASRERSHGGRSAPDGRVPCGCVRSVRCEATGHRASAIAESRRSPSWCSGAFGRCRKAVRRTLVAQRSPWEGRQECSRSLALANYFRVTNLAVRTCSGGPGWQEPSTPSPRPCSPVTVRGRSRRCPTVLAGVSGSEWGETVIARAVVLAAEDDADLLVIHVNLGDRLSRRQAEALERYRVMTLGADGRYAEVDGTNAADALAETARDRRATRVVVARHRARLGELRSRLRCARGSGASSLAPWSTRCAGRRNRPRPPGRCRPWIPSWGLPEVVLSPCCHRATSSPCRRRLATPTSHRRMRARPVQDEDSPV